MTGRIFARMCKDFNPNIEYYDYIEPDTSISGYREYGRYISFSDANVSHFSRKLFKVIPGVR